MILPIILLSLASSAFAQNCTSLTGTADASKCSVDIPYCRQIKSLPFREFKCVSCISTCDCETDEYCDIVNGAVVDYEGYGTCQKFKPLIGRPCQMGVDTGSYSATDLLKYGDRFCGVVRQIGVLNLNSPTVFNNYTIVEGECIASTCQVCDSYMTVESSGAVWVEKGLTSNGGVRSQFSNAGRLPSLQCQAGSGRGVPRYCKNFVFVPGSGSKNVATLLVLIVPMLAMLI